MPLKQVFPKNNDKDIVAGVYEIRHKATGKSYVGSTGNLGSRAGTNLSALRHGKHKNKPLQEAYNNDPAVELTVLKVCDTREEALCKEQEHLDRLIPMGQLFNVATDSKASNRGVLVTEETRKKLSEKLTGLVRSQETVERIRQSQLGKVYSEERKAVARAILTRPDVREKIIKANTGRIQSEEERKKKRLANLGKKHRPESIELMRKVAVTPAKPVIIQGIEYASIKEAARQLGVNPGSLSSKLSSGKNPDYVYAKSNS